MLCNNRKDGFLFCSYRTTCRALDVYDYRDDIYTGYILFLVFTPSAFRMSSDKYKYDRRQRNKIAKKKVGTFGQWKPRGNLCELIFNWRLSAHKRRCDTRRTTTVVDILMCIDIGYHIIIILLSISRRSLSTIAFDDGQCFSRTGRHVPIVVVLFVDDTF